MGRNTEQRIVCKNYITIKYCYDFQSALRIGYGFSTFTQDDRRIGVILSEAKDLLHLNRERYNLLTASNPHTAVQCRIAVWGLTVSASSSVPFAKTQARFFHPGHIPSGVADIYVSLAT